MAALRAYRATIDPAWIDYNGHLRDAYYGLLMSLAIDDVMDQVGLNAEYRARSGCTLFTLELHLFYSHEVRLFDPLTLITSILDADRKRLHAGCRFTCPRMAEPLATGEAMLLHVHQAGPPAAAPFPMAVEERLAELKVDAATLAAWTPASRKIQITRR